MPSPLKRLRQSLKYLKIRKAFIPRLGSWSQKRDDLKNKYSHIKSVIHRRESNISWHERFRITLASEDNLRIPRGPDAGTCKGNTITMHNGLQIASGSYYGTSCDRLFELNRGVHEPQEEFVFQEVLKYIPENSTMLELGAYWSFYSMWFQKVIPGAQNIMVEPENANLHAGRLNFKLNHCEGLFLNGFIADKPSYSAYSPPTLTVDSIAKNHHLNNIHILHSDIQGFEYKMLLGAQETIANRKIDFIFISTHSDQVHAQCKQFLLKENYLIIAEHSLAESFSVDGLIVGKRKEIHPELTEISTSKRLNAA